MRRDFLRFNEFVSVCMKDFVAESAARTWPPAANGRLRDGTAFLYDIFRCGFVHQAHPGAGVAKWGRYRPSPNYWIDRRGLIALNIDALVPGFMRGLDAFQAEAANRRPDLRSHFVEYLEAD